MAAYGALAGIGTAFGLIVGGVLTTALSWRYGFFLDVPVGLAAIIAAPRPLEETDRQAGRLDPLGALSSTLGASALVFGIVHSAGAGWGDPVTIGALVVGLAVVTVFVTNSIAPPSCSCRCACSPTARGLAPTPRGSCSTACW
jgi:MFS family permease